jgi:polygalacturonase
MKLPNRFHSFASYFLATIGYCAFINLALAVPTLPTINTNNVVNITNFGVVSSTTLTNTTAIQNAINFASVTNGGATVEIPAGTYLSGPLTLQSKVNLQIDSGAVLRMLPFGQYPVTWFTNGSNIYFTANNFISGTSLTDIEISGLGAIDGQGLPWWPWANTNNAVRPIMIRLSGCNRELIQNVTLSNSPMFHISISGKAGNTTVQGVTIRAPSSGANPPSHNTDACDVSGTNILVQNCDISVGDDNFTCGGGTSDVLITNNTYGNGHGVSIGSYTSPSVSNIIVINCTFNGTDNGIRIKSDRDRGGLVQNISYYNLSMTNVMHPILIYCQYTNTTSAYRAVDSITPAVAAGFPSNAVISTTPIYRNIIISNVTATAQSTRSAGLIWGLPEMCVSNLTLTKIKITADKTFYIHEAKGVQLVDSQIITPGGVTNVAFFNAQITFTNSTPGTNVVSLDGASTNGIGNTLLFYNAQAWLKNTNALTASPGITLGGSTFSITNNLNLPSSSVVNFVLGTNATMMVVANNLALSGTINVSAGAGFTNTTYTLFTYGKTLTWGPPTLGSTPPNFNCGFDTNTAGQVNLGIALSAPAAPTNLTATGTNLLIKLKWNAVSGAASYNLKRGTASGGPYPTVYSGLVVTNYSDAAVTNAVTYYYVVTAVSGGESTNSLQASAAPLPSLTPTNITLQASSGQLQLSWPPDHLGWRLQIQTNDLSQGLGTNWVTVPNSTNVFQTNVTVNPTNGSVFLRLVYP